MQSYQNLIAELGLIKHPEGGYYRETYRSTTSICAAHLPSAFTGDRSICTSIYFLLPSEERSMFHRIKSDEIWNYHAGSTLNIYVIVTGRLQVFRLGPYLSKGDQFQVVVPANCWFAAKCEQPNSFTLAGCTVSPGFDFSDFEIGERQQLLNEFPALDREIRLLTAQ